MHISWTMMKMEVKIYVTNLSSKEALTPVYNNEWRIPDNMQVHYPSDSETYLPFNILNE
jgi:hypothetical protein